MGSILIKVATFGGSPISRHLQSTSRLDRSRDDVRGDGYKSNPFRFGFFTEEISRATFVGVYSEKKDEIIIQGMLAECFPANLAKGALLKKGKKRRK